MDEKNTNNTDIAYLRREYHILKSSSGNFRCRNCLMVDGYSLEEKKCRWCGQELYEMDKV